MRSAKKLKRLHLWVPDITGVGGIQQYSRMLLRGLEELLPQTQIRVLSKNDLPEQLAERGRTSFRSCGGPPAFSRTARMCALVGQEALRHRPDLLLLTHLHFAPVAHYLKKVFGLRYWVAAHGLEAWSGLSPVRQRALAAAEKILPVSRHTQTQLEKLSRLDPRRCSLLPNTVDGDAFFPTQKPPHLLRRYGIKPGQKIIFTLARLDAPDRYKGYDRIIESLPRLKAELPDLHYVLAGGGPENERIRWRVRELGLEGAVTLTGYLPDRDLRDHYNLCDLFVMPSAGEGFGIVYLEALACGRRCLAGNGDGSREPLLDGKLGELVDPADAPSLERAVVRLLRQEEIGDGCSTPQSLRARALEHFGFEAFKRRLRVVLES